MRAVLKGKRKSQRPISPKLPLHLILKCEGMAVFNPGIREITSRLAIAIRKAKPGIKKVFEFRPFSRIVTHGPDFKALIDSILLNQQEAMGLVRRKRRSRKETPSG